MTARPDDTAARVRKVIADQLGQDIGAVTDDADLYADLGADSLDLVELLMDLEDTFGIQISEDDMEAVKTVGNAVALIQRMTA